MASTFTPNLNLEKPENATVGWDTALNSNFDTLDTEMAARLEKTAVTLSITVITAMQYNSDSAVNAYQYKTRTITITDGGISAVGDESAWITVPVV